MINHFIATFFALAAPADPILEIHNYPTEMACRRSAAAIARNVRLPGGIRIAVGFKCAPVGGGHIL